MGLGLIVCYVFGTAWFILVYSRSGSTVSLTQALGWCVFPYIIPDLIKIALAHLICRRIQPVLKKNS